jgi:hypothetical protein
MNRPFYAACALCAGLLLAAGCDTVTPATTDAEALSARPVPAMPGFTLTGFQIPESAQYDPVDDVYYISNVADPFGGGGFISRIAASASGDVSGEPDYQWITGLTSPFGMALEGDLLYVVDRDGLYVFEIDRTDGTATQVDFIALGVAGSLLNDVCLGPDGSIYVTDTGLDLITGPTGTDAIYRIMNGDVSVLLAGPALEGPNGCFVDGASVFWTTFLSNKLYRTNPSGKIFTAAELPGGGIDSVVRVGGFFYLSSWEGAGVYRASRGGSQAVLIAEVETPGDMGYDSQRNRLLVPSVFSADGAVHVVPLQ